MNASEYSWVLIDDMAQPLAMLAAVFLEKNIKPLLIWPNASAESDTDLQSLRNNKSIEFHHVRSQEELVSIIKRLVTRYPRKLVIATDLNMDSIGLTSHAEGVGWKSPNNAVAHTLKQFGSSDLERWLFLHSGSISVPSTHEGLDCEDGSIMGLSARFDSRNLNLDRARAIRDEIVGKLAAKELTWPEQIWKDEATQLWFTEHFPVHHSFDKVSEEGQTGQYCSVVGKALGIKAVPPEWFTLAFHESLKRFAGAEFCGSSKTGRKPLSLGAVSLIAVLAYQHARKALPSTTTFFTQLSAQSKDLVSGIDQTKTQKIVVSFWWLFCLLIVKERKHPNCDLTAMRADGDKKVVLEFDWDIAARVFSVPHTHQPDAPLPPSTAIKALAYTRSLLADEPGKLSASGKCLIIEVL